MLIGLVGLIGSGKDTVAEHLVNTHRFNRDSFARSLKDAIAVIFNWDRQLLEGQTDASRAWREQADPFWSERFGRPVTPRWILQYWGTEIMRGHLYDGIWIDSLINRYKGYPTVISDTRFVNEIRTVRQRGGKIILVKRGTIPTQEEMQASGAHQSEWDWIGQEFDYVLDNNGTKEQLYAQIDDLCYNLLPDKKIFRTPDLIQATNYFLNSGY